MEKYNLISRIMSLYENGGNIIQYLKDIEGRSSNSLEDILISYDFQAGSYIQYAAENSAYINNYAQSIADVIAGLLFSGSIIEVGVGEATTLGNVAKKLGQRFVYGGFDISWSRIFYGKEYLSNSKINGLLFTGDLFKMPLATNSVNLLYSSHSLEPNGGREKEALQELYRVASNYVVLLEPASEFASEEGRARMRRNGYINNLKNIIQELNYNLIVYKKFEYTSNPLNPTALYVIEKNKHATSRSNVDLVCPITNSELIERQDHLFSPKGLLSFPKILGIPCLLPNNAILTTKMV